MLIRRVHAGTSMLPWMVCRGFLGRTPLPRGFLGRTPLPRTSEGQQWLCTFFVFRAELQTIKGSRGGPSKEACLCRRCRRGQSIEWCCRGPPDAEKWSLYHMLSLPHALGFRV
jgi:hypothetical protein